MLKPVSIDKGAEPQPALNFDFLRSTGIRLIQQLAGKRWTDFNLHDPGVTILEVLCYAITDLAYRTDFPLQDLLADKKNAINYEKNAFFHKEDILTTNPVTINDYRKVIIDELEEVDNVWLYPLKPAHANGALNGLYKIVVQVSRDTAADLLAGRTAGDEIVQLVRKCFVSRRNLCEDLADEIVILKPVKVTIEADIQVATREHPEQLLAQVVHQLENAMNLPVRYFSEPELREQGYSIDQIYLGPYLKHGFIPDSELSERKTLIDPTELTKTVSQIANVISVKKLRIVSGQQGRSNKPLRIDDNSFPLLDFRVSEPFIRLYHDNFELPVKHASFRALLQKIREAEHRSFISSLHQRSARGTLSGSYQQNTRYDSIQTQFPVVYGIGEEGLPRDAGDARKGQAKQLKGYLLLFEQILANYLAQLGQIGDFFSADPPKKGDGTYLSQPLYDVPGVRYLLKAFTRISPDHSNYDWDAFIESKSNAYLDELAAAIESDETFLTRKNRLFDHFFARFNEFVTLYPVQAYSNLYEQGHDEQRITTELGWKSDLLRNTAKLSSGRVKAFDYLTADSGDSAGFEWKMRKLLHLPADSGTRRLSEALDPEKIVVETGSAAPAQAATEDETADELSWFGDMPVIVLNGEEMKSLFAKKQVDRHEFLPNDAFLLDKQDMSVLKHALDIRNFRVGPDPDLAKSTLLLYKSPDTTGKWQTISRFSSSAAAMRALKNLIAWLRQVNIRAEGFYLVEHILLRPDLKAMKFGFRYATRTGHKILEHSRWTTFHKRDENLGSLVEVLTGEHEITAELLAPLCRVVSYPGPDVSFREIDAPQEKNMFDGLRSLAANEEKFLPRFEMLVKGENDQVIGEDFFSLKMSVVFPAWPARFQDRNFRSAAENLFRMNIPAHITVNFIWMNVTNLKKFEALYFDWKKFTADGMAGETRDELRNALIGLLYRYAASHP